MISWLEFSYFDALDLFCPGRPFPLTPTVGIALFLDLLHGLLERQGQSTLVKEIAPHVDYLVDILNEYGAFLLTGTAGSACPDLIFSDDVTDEPGFARIRRRSKNGIIFVRIIPGFNTYHFWGKVAADRIGRAVVRASATVRTRVKIQNVLPRKSLKTTNPNLFQFHPVLDTPANRLYSSPVQIGKEHIWDGSDYVEMLRDRQVVQQGEKYQYMSPVTRNMNEVQCGGAESRHKKSSETRCRKHARFSRYCRTLQRTSVKYHVRNHECSHKPQDDIGLVLMSLCAGMGVPGRMKYCPADDSYDTDPQNDDSRIIFKDIIKETWGARKKRQVELRGEALADESKGPEREDHETGEKQNV